MERYQKEIREFMEAARQSVADKPSAPTDDVRILRGRLTLEEALEFIAASGLTLSFAVGSELHTITKDTKFHIVASGEADLVEVADSIADIGYVNYGAACAYGLDMEPLEKEVHRNNMTKFVDGWFDEHGKLRKGPSYKPVDLEPLINEQK
jgi:predicted HAD superfamily Cof-like phosphohydrolase